jgi:hypothetical protein
VKQSGIDREKESKIYKHDRPIIRIMGYNPLNASREERRTDIAAEASNFDVIMMAGTGRRANKGEEIHKGKAHRFTTIDAGWQHGQFTNKACGSAIWLGSMFQEKHIVTTDATEGKIRGRGLMVRVKIHKQDYTFMVMYYPPRPHGAKQREHYLKTVDLLTKWAEKY